MRTYSPLFLALILGASFGLKTSLLQAETATSTVPVTSSEAPSMEFGIVDVMRILADSLAIQDIQKQLEKKTAEYQKEFATQDQNFRTENEKLIATQHTLKPEELQKKQADLQKRFEKFQEKVDMLRKKLEFAYRQSMMAIQGKTDEIIARLATTKKLRFVFRDAALAWVKDADKIDLTSEVVTLLNTEVPKFAVKIPTEKEMAQAPQAQAPLANGVVAP